MKVPKVFHVAFLAMALVTSTSASAEDLKLSQRTAEQFQVLQEHVTDANQRMVLANILLGASAFLPLLRSRSAGAVVKILKTDWAELQEASENLGAFYRGELRKFCQYEALHQNNSAPDRRFWLNLAETFAGRMTFFPGSWENRTQSDSVRADFSHEDERLAANVSGVFSGNTISFPVTNIVVVNTRRITLNMNSGGEIFNCDATISQDRRSFSLNCRDLAGNVEVTPFTRLD